MHAKHLKIVPKGYKIQFLPNKRTPPQIKQCFKSKWLKIKNFIATNTKILKLRKNR